MSAINNCYVTACLLCDKAQYSRTKQEKSFCFKCHETMTQIYKEAKMKIDFGRSFEFIDSPRVQKPDYLAKYLNRNPYIKNCVICSSSFKTYYSGKKYCSQRCSSRNFYIRKKESIMKVEYGSY